MRVHTSGSGTSASCTWGCRHVHRSFKSWFYMYTNTYPEIIEIGASRIAPRNPEQISHDHCACCMHMFSQSASETVHVCPNALIHKCKMYACLHVYKVWYVHTCTRGVCVCLRVYMNMCMYASSVTYMRHGNTYCNAHCNTLCNREGRSTHTHKHVHIFTLRTGTHTCTLKVHV